MDALEEEEGQNQVEGKFGSGQVQGRDQPRGGGYSGRLRLLRRTGMIGRICLKWELSRGG